MTIARLLGWWVLAGLFWLGVVGVYVNTSDGRRFQPDRREILVRQLDNGFLVEARTRNNPYPYREFVFTEPAAVGSAVSGLLHEHIPGPVWEK